MTQPASSDSDEASGSPADAGEAFEAAEFDDAVPAAEESDGGDESLDEAFEAGVPMEALDGAAPAQDMRFAAADDDSALVSWRAFEAELADALDAQGPNRFAGRLLAALRRATPPEDATLAEAAAAGEAASGRGSLGLAQLLGAPRGDVAVGSFDDAHDEPGEPAPLERLRDSAAATADAFDELVDAFEDGAVQMLPAIVGLAARGLADGLGPRTLAQLSPAARRALVRSVALASRRLVGPHGADGARVLGRLAAATGQAAARAGVTGEQVARRAFRALPRVAQDLARDTRALERIGRRPLTRAAAAARAPSVRAGGSRVLRLRGPVEIVIRQR